MREFDENRFYEKLTPFFKTPIIGGLVGLPQRNDFLYVSTEEKGLRLLYRRSATSDPQKLLDKPLSGILALHDKKDLLVYKKDEDGNENYNIFQLDFSNNGKTTQITKEPIGSVAEVYWVDNETLVVVGFNEEHYYVRTLNMKGEMVEVFTTAEQVLNSHYDRKNKLIAAAVERRYTKIAIIDISTAEVKNWITQSEDSSCSFPAFSAKGQLAYICDQQVTHDELIIQASDNPEELKKFPLPGFAGFWPFDEDAIKWIDEEQLVVTVGKHGRVSLYHFYIPDAKWTEILPKDLSLNSAVVTSDSIIWTGSSFKRPQAMYKCKDGKNTKLLDMGPDVLDFSIESHWYKTYDERKIHGWLLKNPDPDAPLLVFCHGGPTYAITNSWNLYLVPFVLAGFNVFAPNFRGSTTYGSEFKDLNIGEFGRGDLEDCLYGAKAIAEYLGYKALPHIYGASHGGFLTLRALTKQPDEWLGGVAIVPIADLEEAYSLANSHYKAFLKHFFGGTPEEKRKLYREYSPINFVANLKKPLLIYHGANDSRCPVVSVRRFHEEARKLNLPVELIVAGDEGHGTKKIEGIFDEIKLSVKHLLSLQE